jgi:hypothetical protein
MMLTASDNVLTEPFVKAGSRMRDVAKCSDPEHGTVGLLVGNVEAAGAGMVAKRRRPSNTSKRGPAVGGVQNRSSEHYVRTRRADGVAPVQRRNARPNVVASLKPSCCAMSATLWSPA